MPAVISQLPACAGEVTAWNLDDCSIYYNRRTNQITGEWFTWDSFYGEWDTREMTYNDAARIAEECRLKMQHPFKRQVVKVTTVQRLIADIRRTRHDGRER